jgi:hypothetical protein
MSIKTFFIGRARATFRDRSGGPGERVRLLERALAVRPGPLRPGARLPTTARTIRRGPVRAVARVERDRRRAGRPPCRRASRPRGRQPSRHAGLRADLRAEPPAARPDGRPLPGRDTRQRRHRECDVAGEGSRGRPGRHGPRRLHGTARARRRRPRRAADSPDLGAVRHRPPAVRNAAGAHRAGHCPGDRYARGHAHFAIASAGGRARPD